MESDLRIGRAIIGHGRRHRLRLSEPIGLPHPGHDRSPGGLPDQGRGETGREEERAECHKTPVSRLDAGRADAVVPDLAGALVGRLGLGCFAVVGGGSFEHQRSPSDRLTEEPPPWASPERTAWAVAWTAWDICWRRRMRCAQAGGPPPPAVAAASSDPGPPALGPPVVEPPVAPRTARPPEIGRAHV